MQARFAAVLSVTIASEARHSAASTIRLLQFRNGLWIIVGCIQISEYDIALNAAWVCDFGMIGIGVHLPDGLADLVRSRRQRDCIANDARQSPDGRRNSTSLSRNTEFGLTNDAPDDFIGLFDHGSLIIARRHGRSLESRDGDGL